MANRASEYQPSLQTAFPFLPLTKTNTRSFCATKCVIVTDNRPNIFSPPMTTMVLFDMGKSGFAPGKAKKTESPNSAFGAGRSVCAGEAGRTACRTVMGSLTGGGLVSPRRDALTKFVNTPASKPTGTLVIAIRALPLAGISKLVTVTLLQREPSCHRTISPWVSVPTRGTVVVFGRRADRECSERKKRRTKRLAIACVHFARVMVAAQRQRSATGASRR